MGEGRGQLWEKGEVALSIVLHRLALSLGDHVVGTGAGPADHLLFWPGAFLSIFMECKRSFLFYFVFFVKLKKIYILYLSFHT